MLRLRVLIVFTSLACCAPLASAGDDAIPRQRTGGEQRSIKFDTGTLRGSFRFGHGKFPGIGRCQFLPADVPLTNDTPPNSLLMPEWILTPKGPRDGILWELAREHDATPIPGGARMQFPDRLHARRGLRCRLDYRILDDLIHLHGELEATRHYKNLELMFASYLPDRFNATYVLAKGDDGEKWRRVPRGEPWKSSYLIASSPETRTWRRDGRISDVTELDWNQVFFPPWSYTKPILVALEETTGVAVIHYVDGNGTALIGQRHDHDTAHDFTWGWPSLEPGQKVEARAAVWVTQLSGSHDKRMQQVVDKYETLRRLWEK